MTALLAAFWWLGPAAREAASRTLPRWPEYPYPKNPEARRWLADLVRTGDAVVVEYPDGRRAVLVL